MAKKKTVDLFGDDENVKPQNEFDQLLNSTGVTARGLVPGDKFRGEVLAVSGQEAFLSTGTPTDAVMPFVLGSSDERPKVGDHVDVIVLRARDGEIIVKPVGSRGVGAETDSLEDAFDMEIPVDGTVLDANKGGYRVKIKDHKAFCPVSQMDLRPGGVATDYVGKKFSFIIMKMERGRDLVVSRRKLLEIERAASEGEFLRDAQVGEIYSGQIFRLEKYGAFIRLDNGIEGLIPISELSWGRIGHPQEVVNLEQTVQVKLLRIVEEDARLKVSFSLKAGGSVVDPWSTIEQDYPVGTQIEGLVEHKEPFGLFVNLGLGVTGLLPRSVWRDSVDGASYENKRKGDRVMVRVERIDLEAHKLSLSVPQDEGDQAWRDHQGRMNPSAAAGANAKGSFGSMADLFKGIKGK